MVRAAGGQSLFGCIVAQPVRTGCLLLWLFAIVQFAINARVLCEFLFSGGGRRASPGDASQLSSSASSRVGDRQQQLQQQQQLEAGDAEALELFKNLTFNSSEAAADYSVYAASSASVSPSSPSGQLCPNVPPKLVGSQYTVLTNSGHAPSWKQLLQKFRNVRHGGARPVGCKARQKVAILLPYRNRDQHLRLFLANMHPFLQRQQLDYRIFAIEQAGSSRFNRAILFNVGFKEATKIFNPDCVIFHDVDLLPEHDHNIYRCGRHPRHMSAAVDKFKYKLPYKTIFGGACALTPQQFRTVNGFSNLYFGWGGEDDDFANRVVWSGYKISRYPMSIARYKMIKHKAEDKNKPNPLRFRLIKHGKKRWHSDGLNSVEYNVEKVQDRQVVYFISVEIPESTILRKFKVI